MSASSDEEVHEIALGRISEGARVECEAPRPGPRACACACDLAAIGEQFRSALVAVGEDVDREGIVETPLRFARALAEFMGGYCQSASGALAGAVFDEPHLDGPWVAVRDIEFFSSHRDSMLPFFGRCHVVYAPGAGKVAGLSKVGRIVDVFARRLQTAQGLAEDVAGAIQALLAPRGVLVACRCALLGVPGDSEKAGEGLSEALATRGCFAPGRGGDSAAGESGPADGRNGVVTHAEEALELVGWPEGWSRGESCLGCYSSPLDESLGKPRILSGGRAHGIVSRAVLSMFDSLGCLPSAKERMPLASRTYASWLMGVTAGRSCPLPAALEAARLAWQDPRSSWCREEADPFTLRCAGGKKRLACEFRCPVGSVCEHHVLPFFGSLYVVVVQREGASTGVPAHMVHAVVWKFSRQLQLQERLASQIAACLDDLLDCSGVLVVVSAYHHCMRARGVGKTSARTVSVERRGIFEADRGARMACLQRFGDRRT